MKKHESSRRGESQAVQPGREHWWWRPSHLKRALNGNRQLDYFLHWKVKGRKNPEGKKWTPAQRQAIETALWVYELDARISHKFLFRKPAHLLAPDHLSSVVGIARTMSAPPPAPKAGRRRRPFAWTWIEYFDKRDEKKSAKLTRAELNGIIAAMKYCLEYFIHG